VSDLRKLIAAAAVFALLLFLGVQYVGQHGIGPGRHLVERVPDTTDPETTASGTAPVYASQCAFVPTSRLGAVCTFLLRNPSGGPAAQSFESLSLAVDVPRSWLAGFPQADAPDNVAVVAALVASPYAPGGVGGLAVSVDPSYGAQLRAVGVSPTAFLQWLYRNVPQGQWPPWVPHAAG
jgi:hypothetical protein